MEGVPTGSYHHSHFFQRISSSSELGPVHPILIAAAVMPASVPHSVQVGMSTGIIPPSSLMVVGTVPWKHKEANKDPLVHKQAYLLLGGLGADH